MAGRELEAVERAVAAYVAGANVTTAAAGAGVSTATLNRALDRRGIIKRGPPRGPAHPAWIDGRTSARRSNAG